MTLSSLFHIHFHILFYLSINHHHHQQHQPKTTPQKKSINTRNFVTIQKADVCVLMVNWSDCHFVGAHTFNNSTAPQAVEATTTAHSARNCKTIDSFQLNKLKSLNLILFYFKLQSWNRWNMQFEMEFNPWLWVSYLIIIWWCK